MSETREGYNVAQEADLRYVYFEKPITEVIETYAKAKGFADGFLYWYIDSAKGMVLFKVFKEGSDQGEGD